MQFAQYLDLNTSESPQFVGRTIAALVVDSNIMEKSERVLVVAALADEYGLKDIDGRLPRPLNLDEA
jgi:dehydrogenase/reductase SDR family protein 1